MAGQILSFHTQIEQRTKDRVILIVVTIVVVVMVLHQEGPMIHHLLKVNSGCLEG